METDLRYRVVQVQKQVLYGFAQLGEISVHSKGKLIGKVEDQKIFLVVVVVVEHLNCNKAVDLDNESVQMNVDREMNMIMMKYR